MNRLQFRGAKVDIPVQFGNQGAVAFNGQIYRVLDGLGAIGEVGGLASECAALIGGARQADGMYAAVVATDGGSSIYLRTDPWFIKPLFVLEDDRGLAASSELRSLSTLLHRKTVNRDALDDLFCYGWYLGEQTYLDGVRGLWRHDRLYAGGRANPVDKLVALSAYQESSDFEEQVRTLRRLIRESVARCLEGPGPFGLALSGGLDSTILAYELNCLGVEELVTISVRLGKEPDGIEGLSELGLPAQGAWRKWKHVVARVDPSEFTERFRLSTQMFGQPTTMSSLPLYTALSDAAAQHGVRAMILGEGVDEFFGGYASYRKVSDPRKHEDYYSHGPRRQLLETLLGNARVVASSARFRARFAEQDIRDVEGQLRLARLLLRTDVALMSNSIEGRVPFLHNGIPALARQADWATQVAAPGKRLLRAAYQEDLPLSASRPKLRFKAPDEVLVRCLRDGLQDRIAAALFPHFSGDRLGRTLEMLQSGDAYDADVACLLMSLAFIAEEGGLSVN